jgi:hypothetical protein
MGGPGMGGASTGGQGTGGAGSGGQGMGGQGMGGAGMGGASTGGQGMGGQGMGGASTGGQGMGGQGMGGASTGGQGMGGSTVGALLATEPFDGTAGVLDDTNGGTGWGVPWYVQNDDKVLPGFAITPDVPLTFGTLSSTPSHMTGGRVYLACGRGFDLTEAGAFAAYVDTGAIGKAGTTLWMSVLLRKDEASNSPLEVSLHGSNAVHWNGDPGAPTTVAVGTFDMGSEMDGKRYWSLKVRDQVVRTPVEVVVGQTVLLVASIEFGAPAAVRLWANPANLGGEAPATPTVEVTNVAMPLAFKALAIYPGAEPGFGSIDELRFGTTFAAVTPVVP